jgi:hypothetical protein
LRRAIPKQISGLGDDPRRGKLGRLVAAWCLLGLGHPLGENGAMAQPEVERRLAAVLAADMVG